eukprot:2054629-Lingulodinium_polyedra.AAC.1
MRACPCNSVADLVQAAYGTPEDDVAPSHGSVAPLVERATASRPPIRRPGPEPALADGAQPPAFRAGRWGWRRNQGIPLLHRG